VIARGGRRGNRPGCCPVHAGERPPVPSTRVGVNAEIRWLTDARTAGAAASKPLAMIGGQPGASACPADETKSVHAFSAMGFGCPIRRIREGAGMLQGVRQITVFEAGR